MLDIKRVLKSAKAPERGELKQLATPWGAALDAVAVLPEYPRPTMQRDAYTMLNGWWEYAIGPADDLFEALRRQTGSYEELFALLRQCACPASFEGKILVPFSPEATLSGVGRVLQPNELLWYRRSVELPELDGTQRMLLHFEAVDWACAVFVDGTCVALHQGGYLPLSVDVTDALPAEGESFELALCVYDPSDEGVQPRGKQSLKPGGIWYTPQSGIWQSVWYELVPAVHVEELTLQGDMDGNLVVDARIAVSSGSAAALGLRVKVADADGAVCATASLPVSLCGMTVKGVASSSPCASATMRSLRGELSLADPQLWSPEHPYLYDAELELVDAAGNVLDTVKSYCAFRTVEVKPDEADKPRFFLNGEPYFLKGVLDQGYWSDGLLTASSDEALVHDIEACKAAGFNMLRKHIKVEAARWYYHCDRLGMLVWQDAVQGGGTYSAWHTSQKPTLFSRTWSSMSDSSAANQAKLSGADARYQEEWRATTLEMVRRLKGHPSIVTWVLFNEGWGQFDAARATRAVQAEDPTRPIDATSGWYDQNCGDYRSVHNYFRPLGIQKPYAGETPGRAFVLSEFGGLTFAVEGHVSAEATYGYGDYATAREWKQAVESLLNQAAALESQGCVGYVCTQVSDVEDEINGLMTYDRQVNKLED